MPFATMASAVSRTKASLMLAAKVFHVFQPIGGVAARPSNFWAKSEVPETARRRPQSSVFIGEKEGWGGAADLHRDVPGYQWFLVEILFPKIEVAYFCLHPVDARPLMALFSPCS